MVGTVVQMRIEGQSKSCRCIMGVECEEAARWRETIARLGPIVRASRKQEDEFVFAWRAWNRHMHDVEAVRKQRGLLALDSEKMLRCGMDKHVMGEMDEHDAGHV